MDKQANVRQQGSKGESKPAQEEAKQNAGKEGNLQAQAECQNGVCSVTWKPQRTQAA